MFLTDKPISHLMSNDTDRSSSQPTDEEQSPSSPWIVSLILSTSYTENNNNPNPIITDLSSLRYPRSIREYIPLTKYGKKLGRSRQAKKNNLERIWATYQSTNL